MQNGTTRKIVAIKPARKKKKKKGKRKEKKNEERRKRATKQIAERLHARLSVISLSVQPEEIIEKSTVKLSIFCRAYNTRYTLAGTRDARFL